MTAIRRTLDALSMVLMVIGALAMLGMMLQVMVDVALRNLFKSTLPGTEEMVSAYYMIGVAFLPLAYVQRERGHVIIELFTLKLPPRVIAALDGVVYVVCCAALWFFTYAAFRQAVLMTEQSEIMIGTIDVTVWPARWLMTAGLAVMALYMMLQAVEQFLWAAGVAVRHQPAEHTEETETI